MLFIIILNTISCSFKTKQHALHNNANIIPLYYEKTSMYSVMVIIICKMLSREYRYDFSKIQI